jgi:peptidoglycan/LPS O-acetylase OafA/YrhL
LSPDRPAAPLRLSGHIPGLDGVRGLAIAMVMAIHFVGDAKSYTAAQRLVTKAAGFGLLGVDLFFVLSGFLITGLLLDTKSRSSSDSPPYASSYSSSYSSSYFGNFYARRTLRIFPLYYAVLAVLFVVLPRLVTLTPNLEQAREHQAWLWTYTANFYIAAKSSWSSLTYVSHFWSLAIEEHFYLLWPLVVFRSGQRTLERICVAVILGGLALRIALALAGTSELSISVLTPCRIDTLCVGALLAVRVRRPEGAQKLVERSGRATVALGIAILVLSAWCALAKLGLPVLHQLRSSLYAFFFGALSLASVRPGRSALARLFTSRLMTFLGKYSYGLYVYHGLLTWYLHDRHAEERLDAWLGNHWLTIVLQAAIGVGVSLAVAVMSYELFEKRFLGLKRFFETRAPRELPSPSLEDAGPQ